MSSGGNMANYYTQFSAILTLKNAKEREWIKARYDKETGGSQADFDGSLVEEGFWIKDNGEAGDLEQVAALVQEFLKKFRPDGSFSMEWAHLCDKHRTDGFGGGAVFITSKTMKWLNTNHWLSDRAKNFGKKK
jgi:hypothetical protein